MQNPDARSIINALNCTTALQAKSHPSIIDELNHPQLHRLLPLQAISEKLCHSSPGCWLSRPYHKKLCHISPGCWLSRPYHKKLCHSSPCCWLSRPYQKNYVTALQAVGSPGRITKNYVTALQAASSPGHITKKYVLHLHLQPQFKYELFHIYFTSFHSSREDMNSAN